MATEFFQLFPLAPESLAVSFSLQESGRTNFGGETPAAGSGYGVTSPRLRYRLLRFVVTSTEHT